MAITLYIESISIDTVNLQWIDALTPSSAFDIYRSEDGIAFTLIDSSDAADDEYQDSGLDPVTRYWYKVINASAVESNEASVVTQTCFGIDVTTEPKAAFPTAGEDVTGSEFNEAMRKLEAILRQQSDGYECLACSSNGALVLNCAEGCREFNIEVTEDINSISIIGCEDIDDGAINFRIPAGETWRLCGFPANSGFSGGECRDAPVSGGDSGRTVGVVYRRSRATPASGTGGRGTGSGGGGVPGGGTLAVTCRTEDDEANDNCSMDCSDTQFLKLRITGGRPPYTVTSNVVGAVVSKEASGIYSVTPPPNAGSAVSGVAYSKNLGWWNSICSSCNAFNFGGFSGIAYKCDDSENGAGGCGNTNGVTLPNIDCTSATGGSVCADAGVCEDSQTPPCQAVDACTGIRASNNVRDNRTAGMITDGCAPCGTAMNSKTVTVTDSLGASVVTVMRA